MKKELPMVIIKVIIKKECNCIFLLSSSNWLILKAIMWSNMYGIGPLKYRYVIPLTIPVQKRWVGRKIC